MRLIEIQGAYFFEKFIKITCILHFYVLQYRKVKDNTYIERLKGDLYEINKSTELYNGEGTQRN